MSPPAKVYLWGVLIGAVSYMSRTVKTAVFEYHPDFLDSGIQVAPLTMPLRRGVFRFPEISIHTFKGLPGMLADSLPDKFGDQLIDKHMATLARTSKSITAIDRLHYVGARAMGALEYSPAQDLGEGRGGILDLAELAELADLTLAQGAALGKKLKNAKSRQAAFDLLRVGTSAGGARAKALIALDAQDNPKVGHMDHGIDHTYWLLKFDGVAANKDRERADPPGMTVLEYIYSRLAENCGIHMPRCRLLEVGDLRHFLIERFDRVPRKQKLSKVHYTSWAGMAHAHRDETGAYSYEQLVLVMRQLSLPQSDITELFRRAVFNVIGRNQDDHTKNFGFVMDREGHWALSPAFDMMYAYDPEGKWTKNHQITLNGKGNAFTREDLLSFGKACSLSARDVNRIVEKTLDSFSNFASLAREMDLPSPLRKTVQSQLRLKI